MPQSMPSDMLYIIDVPEIKQFNASFFYNFFTPDEAIREINEETIDLLKSLEEENYTNSLLSSRAPRFVFFSWKKPRLTLPGEVASESDSLIRRGVSSQDSSFSIKKYYDKIVTEDSLSLKRYVNATFGDGDIEEKLKELMTVSSNIMTPLVPRRGSTRDLSEATAGSMNLNLPYSLIRQEDLNFDASNSRDERRRTSLNRNVELLKDLGVKVKLGAKALPQIIKGSMKDPLSWYKADLFSLNSEAQNLAAAQQFQQSSQVLVPKIGVIPNNNADEKQRLQAEIVGYVIEKWEVTPQGDKQLEPIIIENEKVANAYDFRIKYGATYKYRIKTIALFNVPAIDADTNDVAIMQMLVSSKPTNAKIIKIEDKNAPPPPTDTSFTWNYETGQLLIHWTFPPNPQRDIKKFQVFRRKKVQHPFEIIKEYNFNNSLAEEIQREKVMHGISTKLLDADNQPMPLTFYIDEDFTKDSNFIYSLCSIDVHGITSCYGPQFEVSFDKFKNQIVKKLVSHSGAPKAYPNLYLEGTGFLNAANVVGSFTKRMHLYFTPQFYYLRDERENKKAVVSTKQKNGNYKFLFINADNQKCETLTVNIDDLLTDVE